MTFKLFWFHAYVSQECWGRGLDLGLYFPLKRMGHFLL